MATTTIYNYYLDRPSPFESPYKKLILKNYTAVGAGDIVYHNIRTKEHPSRIPDLWRVVRGKLHLVASAEVANRRLMVNLVTNFGQSSESHGLQTAFITASEDYEFFFATEVGRYLSDVVVQGDGFGDLGHEFIASYPDYFLLRSYNTQAGDVVTGWVTLEYMNYRLGIK